MSVETLKDDQFKALKATSGYNQARELIETLEEKGFEAYLVGGCVRDVLLGRALKDFDMCTSATPEEMKKVFKDFKLLLQGENFGTVSVVVDKTSFEITSFRGDGLYSNSRHPDSVKFVTSLKEDLLRRDFTVNALAFHPVRGLVNLVGGYEDLELKVLKTVGDPDKRFEEDALRIVRLLRFAVQLNFKIDDKTFEAAKNKSSSVKKISKERVFTEFKKMLAGRPHFKILDQLFKTSFESFFEIRKELSLFEKAYVAILMCEKLDVVFEDYILEKSLRDRCLALIKIKSSCDLRSDFVKTCDKYELYDQEQLDLWRLVCGLLPERKLDKIQPYSKKAVLEETQSLKEQCDGKALGAAIFEFKKKTFFG